MDEHFADLFDCYQSLSPQHAVARQAVAVGGAATTLDPLAVI